MVPTRAWVQGIEPGRVEGQGAPRVLVLFQRRVSLYRLIFFHRRDKTKCASQGLRLIREVPRPLCGPKTATLLRVY